MKNVRHALLVVLFLLVGCCAARAQDPEEMQRLASDLLQLSPAVEAVVRYEPEIAVGMTDRQLLEYATRTNPEKLANFRGLVLKVGREDRHASVLVCDEHGREAWLEDAACTMMCMERHHWKKNPKPSCALTLDLKAVCANPTFDCPQ